MAKINLKNVILYEIADLQNFVEIQVHCMYNIHCIYLIETIRCYPIAHALIKISIEAQFSGGSFDHDFLLQN